MSDDANKPGDERTSDDEPTAPVGNSMFPAGARTPGDDDEEPVRPSEPTVQWTTGSPPPPRGVVPPMSEQYYREDRESMDDSKRGLYLLLAVVAAALIVAGVSWYYGIARYEQAPRLVGMTETNAMAEADAAGFTFKVGTRVFSETAPLGTVMKTDPEPGDRVLPGALIEGTVSKGPERHPVPKLRGLTVEAATAALRKERLRVGAVTQDWSDVIPKGSVRNLKGVKVGDRLKRNAKVSFVVSKGREPIQVVNTAGQTRGSAYYTLQSRGFLVAVRQQYSDRVVAGRVISQYPSSGIKYKGDTITITVSLGPERIKVPGVVGNSRDDAEDTLKDAGFKVSVHGGDGKILKQDPAGGDKAKVGSTVNIWAAAGPAPDNNDRHKND